MLRLLGDIVAFAFVAAAILVLYAIVRFSIVSSARTARSRQRLRHPDPYDIERICGFAAPQSLVEFYRDAPFVESLEFHLADRRRNPPTTWAIGRFTPLTARDVKEWKKISRVPGIPIARDLDAGTYFVSRTGAVMLRSRDVSGGEVQVAPDITSFARFEVTSEPQREMVCRALKDWFDGLPRGIATFREEPSTGTDVHVTPVRAGCVDVAFVFPDDDAMDVHWGEGFQVEELPANPSFAVQVCEAIRRGRVGVESWSLAGATILWKSTIEVGSERVVDRILGTLSFLKPLATRSVQHSRTWDPEGLPPAE